MTMLKCLQAKKAVLALSWYIARIFFDQYPVDVGFTPPCASSSRTSASFAREIPLRVASWQRFHTVSKLTFWVSESADLLTFREGAFSELLGERLWWRTSVRKPTKACSKLVTMALDLSFQGLFSCFFLALLTCRTNSMMSLNGKCGASQLAVNPHWGSAFIDCHWSCQACCTALCSLCRGAEKFATHPAEFTSNWTSDTLVNHGATIGHIDGKFDWSHQNGCFRILKIRNFTSHSVSQSLPAQLQLKLHQWHSLLPMCAHGWQLFHKWNWNGQWQSLLSLGSSNVQPAKPCKAKEPGWSHSLRSKLLASQGCQKDKCWNNSSFWAVVLVLLTDRACCFCHEGEAHQQKPLKTAQQRRPVAWTCGWRRLLPLRFSRAGHTHTSDPNRLGHRHHRPSSKTQPGTKQVAPRWRPHWQCRPLSRDHAPLMTNPTECESKREKSGNYNMTQESTACILAGCNKNKVCLWLSNQSLRLLSAVVQKSSTLNSHNLEPLLDMLNMHTDAQSQTTLGWQHMTTPHCTHGTSTWHSPGKEGTFFCALAWVAATQRIKPSFVFVARQRRQFTLQCQMNTRNS